MKKILFLVLVSFVWTVALVAEPVTPSQAREKASQFLHQRIAKRARASAPTAKALKMMAVGKDDSYYIFNVGDGDGYVVVSGEDATEDILGYSDTGSIDPDNMPCGMRMLLDNNANQIKLIRDNGITRDQNVSARKMPAKSYHIPSTLARYDQWEPFNGFCPKSGGYTDDSGNYHDRCPTGCVATAMAQLMYYYRWPRNTTSTIPAYQTETNGYSIDAIQSGSSIDWINILPEYVKDEYNGYNSEHSVAIANLMKMTGTSVHMDYEPSESGAYPDNVTYALKKYFGYETAVYEKASSYSWEVWLDKLRYAIENNGPIIYIGTTEKYDVETMKKTGSRHAFMLEGYDEDGYFDINFGWGGTKNDKFLLDCILQNNIIKYSSNQGAVLNVKPQSTLSPVEIPLKLATTGLRPTSTNLYSRSQSSNQFEDVTLWTKLRNYSPIDTYFDYGFRFVLQDNVNIVTKDIILGENMRMLSWGKNGQNGENTSEDGGYQDGVEYSFNVSNDIPNGWYIINCISKESGTSVWYDNDYALGIYAIVCNDKLVFPAGEEDVSLLNLFSFTQTSEATLRVGQPSEFCYMIENLLNNDVDLYDGYIFATVGWKEGNDQKVIPIFIDEIQVLPNSCSNMMSFTFTPSVSGKQDIVFYNKNWEEIGHQTVNADPATFPLLEVTDLKLMTGDLNKGLIDGTILSGSLDIKNNDAETIEEEVIIGLEDVESPQTSKTKSISVSIDPSCVEGYDIRFYNLTANHRYVITASHVTGEEFYRSPELLCKTGYEIETYPSMYSEYQVLNEPYVKTNMAAFKTNVRVAGDRIWNAINKYQSHGIVAKKADLVGHSMGGVLSRLHVQYAIGGTENVHKVITVNTPHSGSPLGDIGGPLVSGVDNDINSEIDQINYLKNFDSIIDEFFGWDSRVKEVDNIDLQAVSDLGVNSEATDNYLNKNSALDKMNNIPVHAIVTDVTGLSASDIEYLSGEDEMWLGLVRIAGKLGLKYMWEDDTDLIVSVQSQKGGLESPFFSTIHDQWHCGSTRNDNVQKRLIELLNAPVHAKEEKDQVFCFTGFRPDDISLKDYQIKQSDFASTKRRVSAVGVEPTLTASVNDNMLTASMAGAEGYDYQLMLIQFGKEAYSMVSGSQIECEVPASFYGDATVYGIVRMEDEGILWSKTQINIPTPRASRTSISASALSIYYDEAQPVSLTCTWSDGSETHVLPDVISFTDNLARYENGYVTGLHAGSGTATFGYEGLSCEVPFTVYNFGKSDDKESSQSVCSTITLKLSQTMTMTRQAFRGTLTMFNGNEAMSMKDVKLALKITNVATGEVATAHEFQINPESIDGFTGEVNLSSGWTLAGNTTGKATVLFIPTKYAAPTEPVEWSFGGTLSYLDPFTGLEVTRDLYPVTLTVKPSPELDLDYFLQRDVFGDDPLTEEVEPMQPAEFALLINNKGYGDATNVRMVTQQPQIIDNEKGLLIDFELLSSQVNGSDKTLAFGQSIANDFGTIDAQSQAYAQWWLQSSLLGHFTEYSVKANHVTSYGNEDLSLLDQVNIHELIHGFTPTSGGRGFLVNDIVDAADMPDGIYFTDATQESVSIATNATLTKQGDDYLLTVMPTQTGWNYGSLIDPTDGKKEITSIIRQSDGVEIPLDNIWRTDRTLRDGKDPIAENRLHFVGNILSDSESYLLSFTPREEVSNVVTGHVAAQTENGQPVVGATVTLCSGDVVYTTTTDGAGYFTLKVDETSLDYVMTCTAEGFIDGAEKEVRFLGDAVKCNYTLMPGATIKIPASGICTYSSVVGLDFSQATLPVKAYYGKRYDTERVIIDELTTAAANEGLVLMGQPNSRVDVPEAVNVAPLAENVLYGTAFAPYTVTSDDVYVLANKTGKPKFHQAAQGLVIPKNKAYLLLFIGESGSKGIDVIFDEATLIDMIRSAENRENHYGIDGIRIGETVKGIHVVKGKKLIVK